MLKVPKHQTVSILNKTGCLQWKLAQTVSNKSVVNNYDSKSFNTKKNLYNVIARRSGDVIMAQLNGDFKHNTLDRGMLKELTRFLESYDIDSSVRAVFLENAKEGAVFSKGTDFKYLMKNIAEKQPHKAFDYLREVYDFSIFMSKYNKPLLININGAVSGSAAGIFTRAPFAMGSKNTSWRLNETSLGYIPDAGASYYLSRLSNELGTFLALTGWKIDGYDMSRSGIAFERMFITHEELEKNWKLCHKKHDQALSSKDLYGSQKYVDQAINEIHREQYSAYLNEELFHRIHKKDSVQFRKENKRLALAEILYRHQLQDRANIGYKVGDQFYQNHNVLNYLEHYEQDVLFDLGLCNIEMTTSGSVTSLPLFTIGRCFSANSVEEIIERLKQEDTHFSRATLKSLEAKSPVALKLTLSLIRQGLDSSWKECFEREFRVAARRLLDPEVMRSMSAQLVGDEKNFNDWDFKTLQSISNDHIASYFRPFEEEKRVADIAEFQGNLKDNCFYPVKDYYRSYSDTVRFYLNQDNLRNAQLREAQEYDVHEFLLGNKINSKNPAVDVADLREKFYLKEKLQRKKEEQLNRLGQISGSEFAFKTFYDSRKAAIEELFADNSKAEEKVEAITDKIFQDFRNERLEAIKKISKVAAVEKKQDFFMKLRQKIIDERLMVNEQETDIKIEDYPGLQYPLFFPNDNKENMVEAHNPYVKNLFKDLLGKIDIQSKGHLVKQFKYSEKEIEALMEEKEFGKKLIDRLNFQYNEPVWWETEVRKIYELRFGDSRGPLVDKWYDSLIESGYKVDGIREFLTSTTNEEVKEILKNNQTDNLKDYVHEFLSELQSKKTVFDESESLEQQKLNLEQTLSAVKQGIKDYQNLVTLNNNEKQTVSNNLQGKPHEYSLDLFKKYIAHDDELKEALSLVLEPASKNKNSVIERTRQDIQRLLTQIIQGKLEQIYGKNNVKSCLVTENGEKYYQFDHAFMTRFDNYIVENLEFDIQQYLSTHTLFMLGALGLQRLEGLFRRIYNATRKLSKSPQEISEKQQNEEAANLIATFKDYGLEVSSPEELKELTDYLNKLTSVFASLYSGYKNQLIFSEDKALELQNRAKFIKEREYDELSFTNYAVMAYEQKQKFIEGLSNLAETSDIDINSKEKIDHHIKSLTTLLDRPLKQNETKTERVQTIQYELAKLDTFKESKQLITGFVIYAEKLDRLTQSSIHGKAHYVPEELQIEQEEAKIPLVFDNLDSRMSPQTWLDAKLKIFLRKIFDQRYQQEKTLNHHDLLMLDFEISKLLSPESIKQSIYEELERDVQTLRLCREFDANKTHGIGSKDQELYHEAQADFGKIRNPKALEKLHAFRIWRENKYSERDPDAGEFERIIKIEGELEMEARLAPTGQIESDKEIEKAYLHLLDIPDLSEIDTTRITKEKTLIEEYRLSIEHMQNSTYLAPGDKLLEDINLFIKQISS